MSKKMTVTPIHIGAQVGAIREARQSIMEILNCNNAGDDPKVAALRTLESLCAVRNVAITGNTFNVEPEKA